MKSEYWVIEKEGIIPSNKLIANEYLIGLKLANKSEATIDKYRRILEKFLMDCPKIIGELVAEDIHTWLIQNYGDKKARTKELVLGALSGFFKFCLAEEYINGMLIKNRWRPKIPQSLPKYLNEYELARVKIQAERMSIRDRALIEFMYSSGCRRSEVIGLNVEDINLKKRTAQVVGKGKKIREVHFSQAAALLLEEYLHNHPKDIQALFVGRFNKRLGATGIYRICRILGEKAGLAYNLSPHMSRHTFATNMLARGAELEFIGEELGHRDLNTTRIYARIPSEEIMSEYRKRME